MINKISPLTLVFMAVMSFGAISCVHAQDNPAPIQDSTQSLDVHLYGKSYVVLITRVEGSMMDWEKLIPYIPPEILDENNPALTPQQLQDHLNRIIVPYIQKYEKGVADITRYVRSNYASQDHGNLDLEIAELFLMDNEEILKERFPELSSYIDQVREDFMVYSAILILIDNVEENIRVMEAGVPMPE